MSGEADAGRRDFLKLSLAAGAAQSAQLAAGAQSAAEPDWVVVDDFNRADDVYHGEDWETLNPGYWQIKENALRRKLKNVGDQRPGSQFPWHWETHRHQPMPTSYDPSLPLGMLWRRDWKLSGSYSIRIEGRILRAAPRTNSKWKMHQPGYGLVGIAFGGECLHETWHMADAAHASHFAAWRDDGEFGVYQHTTDELSWFAPLSRVLVKPPQADQAFAIELDVEPQNDRRARVTARLGVGKSAPALTFNVALAACDGYFGLVARGLLDFQLERVSLKPGSNKRLHAPASEMHVCYPLGDTLVVQDGRWRCRFIALFRSGAGEAQIRISQDEQPAGGWGSVPVAGSAKIITNDFRRSTSVIDALLPANPTDATLFYTVWRDGRDVTADVRQGTHSVGSGTGFLGTVPESGNYVGRLPRLAPPYKLCGLSCHAICDNKPDLPHGGRFQANWVHDQPTPKAYADLDEYGFQVLVWEDDVWYLELCFPPPSTDDAYKVITTTIAGPTTRWQMMRHWNVLNPGDHDYGMDDVKGPEQLIIRRFEGLGQDPRYMQRNFQIVSHLVSGDENPKPLENPRRWRRWKMPQGDFTLLILDSRLWRTSQDTHIWDDEGWDKKGDLYSRRDPTRTLLGEEQFAWLTEMIRTDSAPLICLTGISGLHPIWAGTYWGKKPEELDFQERDRVAADFAGWVAAGADRILELLGSRSGLVSVYGDVHAGCILRSVRQRIYECSFGPIGRYGARAVKLGFGRKMQDFDGRPVEVVALYHEHYQSPDLEPITGPSYWNFLEMQFDPRLADAAIELRLRNIIDRPNDSPRGGGRVEAKASDTGRAITSRLPELKTLANADVQLLLEDGRPLRGAKADATGTIHVAGLVDVLPGTPVVLVAHTRERTDAQRFKTLPLAGDSQTSGV